MTGTTPRRVGRLVGLLVLVAAAVGAGFALGRLGAGGPASPAARPAATPAGGASSEVGVWTCSMHPQIQRPGPGKCPICGMDLVPVAPTAAGGASPRRLTLSPEARALAGIETRPVERRFVTAEVRMIGKVDYDETAMANITAWISGRLDRLFVDYTGIRVAKGDHMVEIYSPDLLAAQEELLQAVRASRELDSSTIEVLKSSTRETVTAARERLRLWGLTKAQVEAVEKSGRPEEHVTIYAPMGGTVTTKAVLQGAYVQPGTLIYAIADLSSVWVILDAYESNLTHLRYGQEVTFMPEALPGETFTGRIAFISPVLDPMTRTVKVRINVPNPAGKLKPAMFVHAVVRTDVAESGPVMDASMAGKFICPMHPEVMRDAAGECPKCGMPLERTEALGYVSAVKDAAARPLVIPASAPLVTGARAVVYVEIPGSERPTFEGREVVLGPRAGDYYIVREGPLREGDRVVTQGAFRLDSDLQIQARPSMMMPQGGGGAGHPHGASPPSPPPAPPSAPAPGGAKAGHEGHANE